MMAADKAPGALRHHARNLRRRRVVAEFELVRRPIRQDALKIEDRVARIRFGVHHAS
jgi:hypothetical protein